MSRCEPPYPPGLQVRGVRGVVVNEVPGLRSDSMPYGGVPAPDATTAP